MLHCQPGLGLLDRVCYFPIIIPVLITDLRAMVEALCLKLSKPRADQVIENTQQGSTWPTLGNGSCDLSLHLLFQFPPISASMLCSLLTVSPVGFPLPGFGLILKRSKTVYDGLGKAGCALHLSCFISWCFLYE